MTTHRCSVAGCGRFSHPGRSFCTEHIGVPAPSHDLVAARLDPTTDRDRWDVWNDGGLEAPGEDEW